MKSFETYRKVLQSIKKYCKIINRRVEWYKKYSTTNRTRAKKYLYQATTSVARSVWYEYFLVPSEIRSGIFFISRDPEVDNFIITLQFSELEFLYHFGKSYIALHEKKYITLCETYITRLAKLYHMLIGKSTDNFWSLKRNFCDIFIQNLHFLMLELQIEPKIRGFSHIG